MSKNKFYVTSPIYYVNSKPHLGTLYSTLICDVVARWNKLLGKEVFFLTGTDEHGQKVAQVAKQQGKDTKEFVDSMIPPFKEMWQLYEIGYDRFIRTTDQDHERAVVDWIKRLLDQGDIYKSVYKGWYCVPCEAFVSSEEESPGVCPTCKRQLQEISEENYFFRLSAYKDKLLELYKNNPNFITPKERLNEVVSFVSGELKDLSISRKGVSWGIPFPGDESQTIYVWADALNNYVSGVGFGSDEEKFLHFWPADLHVMAKDIIKFHAVYWPAFLMAADLELPKKLLVHGFILSGESKMSKSLGNVVDPDELAKKYGVEPIRYYLLRQMSVHQDGHFDFVDLENRISGDLANSLGNLLRRTVSLALDNGLKEVSTPKTLEPASTILHEKCEEAFRSYWDNMNHYEFHVALAELWKFISEVNAYFNDQAPWKVVKENKELFEEIIASVCNCLYTIALLLWPVMPTKMEELLSNMGHWIEIGKDYGDELRQNRWDKKFVLTKGEKPLFVKP